MLAELSVRNLLIVESATLELGEGFCVLSGETGAGKTLFLDALGLICGGRGGAELVGPFADHVQVSGVFQIGQDSPAMTICAEMGIPCEGQELVLRRRISAAGRSQAWTNDVPVNVATLKRLGACLVEIRVQHEQLRLAGVARQLELIDRYGGLTGQAAAYVQAHQRCLDLTAERDRLSLGDRDSVRELEHLTTQHEAIAALDPQPGQLAVLEQREQLLRSSQEWLTLAREAVDDLVEGERSVAQILGRLARRLESAPDPHLAKAGRSCQEALEAVREAGNASAHAVDAIQADPGEMETLSTTLSTWYDLLRQHGGTETSLLAAREEISRRLEAIAGVSGRRAAVEGELAAAVQERGRLGQALAKARSQAAGRLAKQVHAELAELGMPKARIELVSDPLPIPTALGSVHQEIHVQTNPGIPAAPLGSTASGGESARLTLAMAVVLADNDDTPVLVFDEVDAGVGGRLGAVIARKLTDLARSRTVVAVTHTPQLAAAAGRHHLVRKIQGERETRVQVEALVGAKRLDEIAEMLGGGAAAQRQARALLAETGRKART